MTKEEFNKVATHPLQTWEWGEFREKWGNEVVRLSFGQIMFHRIPFTSYKIGTFEKGPAPTRTMLDELRTLGKEKNLIFIKLEPNQQRTNELTKLMRNNSCVRGKTLFTPTTFWIDLTKSEEELLASFHSKTRYNIRLAQRKGVTVEEDNSDQAFEKYLSLMTETVSRQGFYAHNKRYHQLMWEALKNKIAHLIVAKYRGEIIASWILFAYDGVLYYPYGASSSNPNHYRLMPSALLMWEAIRFGKKLGLKTFDLWGREEGKGFTKFKEGYNPKVIEFLGTWDLVINLPLYLIYRVFGTTRWFILRLKSNFVKPTF
ncbi:hypothetical protein A2614_00505 [Candidatus Woesebacteria bacterium RIFOXYD1_FULL_40_21]|uniref:BioF2-like acetyltransferase domain-containing protein n=1 Tax=Candidatus Woesebacteria bacterium RIFOXYD1_FULL_40_21 TaxID=1802549 RepID=A0A1F8DHJ6_9BACT|nr:MAG: hypothetical protein A2614_00505 [Candidatus Woesebacteria bacterium RIFOXYD1_FULL_40_21]